VGYRPQLARSGSGFVPALVLPQGNAADSRHLVAMVKEQITNTGVIPAMTSADDGYSRGLEEVLGLGSKWSASAEPKARGSSRHSNEKAGLTDRRGLNAARLSHWSSL
jgi:hypothetical protein